MEHYIYALLDGNREPFYIGKSKNPEKRIKRHIYDATNLGMNYPVHNKIRKLLREEIGLDLEIVEDKIPEEEIDERERFWIKSHREQGHRLFNVAEGGEGGKGMTPEMQKAAGEKRRGQKRSEESRKRMSEARQGIVFSDEHKANLSKTRRKRVITEETRKKTSKSSTGQINIKQYKLIDPEGIEHITERGLTDFCRQHDLSPPNLCKVLKGERRDHKGWRIERYGDPELDIRHRSI